jgi:hypothetical protein
MMAAVGVIVGTSSQSVGGQHRRLCSSEPLSSGQTIQNDCGPGADGS